jgi:hypothetical protein
MDDFKNPKEATVARLASVLDEAIEMHYKDPENSKYQKLLKKISRFVNTGTTKSREMTKPP